MKEFVFVDEDFGILKIVVGVNDKFFCELWEFLFGIVVSLGIYE